MAYLKRARWFVQVMLSRHLDHSTLWEKCCLQYHPSKLILVWITQPCTLRKINLSSILFVCKHHKWACSDSVEPLEVEKEEQDFEVDRLGDLFAYKLTL